tara:strand:+ start:166 stop:432 length:267 start_codon:yes stop_codon:yes gene_type:complete
MKKFNEETYQELIKEASEKLKISDSNYKVRFKEAFEYLCLFIEDDVKIPLVEELKIQIPKLSTEDIHSKQNLELFKDLNGSLQILKPL